MNTEQLIYRPMTERDLPAAHQLTTLLNWPHRLEDWQMMFDLSETVVLEYEGELIGTACAAVQGEFASVGLIVVADAYQGNGLGRQLMIRVMDKANARYMVLTATQAGEPLYKKLGFGQYATIEQYQACLALSEVDNHCVAAAHSAWPDHQTLRDFMPADREAVVALLSNASGLERSKVWSLIEPIMIQTWLVEDAGQIVAVAVRRPFGRGQVIGPVVAPSQAMASQLITRHLLACEGEFVRIDTPTHLGLGSVLQDWGLVCVDSVIQMSTGEIPQAQGDSVQYTLVSQAIG